MNELKRILYAEDDVKDIELTLNALDEYKLANEVIVVNDGEEALDFLYYKGKFINRPVGNPAVVLLDIKMPKITGLEVLKQIKSDPNLKMIPAVLLTSSKEEKDFLAGYQLGANAFVVKPVDFRDFLYTVKELGLFWAVINEPPPNSIQKK